MEEEQLKPIREDNIHSSALRQQFSPPKELTERSRESYEPIPRPQNQNFMMSGPDNGPMRHQVQAALSFASQQQRQQAALPIIEPAKRSKQVFDGARPSQVFIPQQTESDEIESADDDEDVSPQRPHDASVPNDDQHMQQANIVHELSNLNQAKSRVASLEPTSEVHVSIQEQDDEKKEQHQKQKPQEQQIQQSSLQGGPAEQSSIDQVKPSGVSIRTSAQLQIPSSSQYSPTIKSEKSPLGFATNDPRSQSYSQMETMKSMDRSQMIGDEYCLLKDLGEGTFGNVKLGKHLSSGQLVAVKILEKKRITDQADVERVIREIKILKSIRHQHIIKLYEIIETKARIFLIMEYACGGELFDYIVRKDRLSEKEACRFYNQIVAGIEFLHSKGIAHRDLKPENLLLDKQKNLKIVDFGLSNTYKVGQTLKTACGSPCYAAPEMIAGKRYNGIEVDIWSSGVTLYAMLCGFLPFEDPDTALLYKKILKGDFELPDFLTNRSIKFLKEILCTDPSTRLSLSEVKQHPWFTQFDQNTTLLDRTDNSRLALSTADDKKLNVYNTQIYGAKGNSSLVEPQKEAVTTTTQMTIKPSQRAPPHPASSQRQTYFAQTNQTVSSLTASVTKPPSNNHQKSISETIMPANNNTNSSKKEASQQLHHTLHNRPSTSLKKNHIQPQQTTGAKASKSHGKRPRQQTTLSAIISSPRQTTTGGGVNSSLKRSAEEVGAHHKSERKPNTTKEQIKEKLKTLKNGKIDNILNRQQKHHITTSQAQKMWANKVPTAISLLNNTMPMPMTKLKIDLASPSTGGSTDVVTKHNNVTGQATQSGAKDAFKNNLARAAKNSSVISALQIKQNTRQGSHQGHTSTNAKKQQSVSLKKQVVTQHAIAQQFIQQSRSVIGGAPGSAHSSLSNKRQKSPRGASQNSQQLIKISNSAGKTQQRVSSNNLNLGNSSSAQQHTFSFVNSKLRNKQLASQQNFQSVHPYTVMAMPQHSSQNNLKESGTISQLSSNNKKNLAGTVDPLLSKMPKAFVKSHQALQVSLGGTNHLHHHNSITTGNAAALSRQAVKLQASSQHTNSVESQLRNVKIALSSKKAPNFLTDYSNALYSKMIREQRQVQSLEVLKKRNGSIDLLQPMRVCHHAVMPEWTSTEQPKKIIETLEALLPLLNVQFVQRKSTFLYEIKLARQMYSAARSVKLELELMVLKNSPFVTVIRLNQKVKLKTTMQVSEVESRLAQYNNFCSQLKQGLNLG